MSVSTTFESSKQRKDDALTHCRVMKLADMPSCLGGGDKG